MVNMKNIKDWTEEEKHDWKVKNMLTVEKLIKYLEQFDKNSLVCGFECNSDSPWQCQSEDNLKWLIHTAKEDREEMEQNNDRYLKSKDEIDLWYKYTYPQDVLIRF